MKLVPYEASFEEILLRYIAELFGFHYTLIAGAPTGNDSANESEGSRLTLTEWQVSPNALFVIIEEETAVGFIRIHYRGPNVAWIEDIFVDVKYRGRGIASSAITAAEDIVKNVPGYTAICLDVSPRNTNAMHLYHKLGYKDLSLITMRKEFVENKRDAHTNLLDLDFHY